MMMNMFGVDAVKTVSVMEGDSVTLQTDTELQTDDVLTWQFGDEKTPIATINSGTGSFSTSGGPNGRFRDRLKLDHQTGSLTITNITSQHAGRYQVRTKIIYRFSVTVYARLSVPVISRNSSQSSSSSYCSLVCSVVNVSHVTLSWYKGNSLLSIISVSDLSITLSLPLEVEYQEKNSYSCVVAYPFTNQTTHLNNTQHCQPCSESVHCCGVTEAVIRLVISALVGVATVAVLVYDIRPRKDEQQRRSNPHTN
ncbi:uncharacterized protein LOC113083756 isoform X2 [Carassius auratus]|uniref:Uncharacterized protein LOC113083756 isoform X2 n=1 Tax=Carassius auratus TaxID=7957 RepID=A0A6P6NN51_CARAU|nr:uncharacterized protein LOC113083756 isoform X2 [Carassius auratus]XP_026110485.1 uncharacterized protein LOC113083756 isoform X2 [Carassius auratus]